ncbi:hypothetical protein cypCar_00008587 [Cyprinus carpio]|nr:hypothetical protein cypCar_00008587 [Cyprinus carpio]
MNGLAGRNQNSNSVTLSNKYKNAWGMSNKETVLSSNLGSETCSKTDCGCNILQEKMYLLLPSRLYFLIALTGLMPAKLGIIFIGGMDLMDHFRGVLVPSSATKSLSANEMTVSVIHKLLLSITISKNK